MVDAHVEDGQSLLQLHQQSIVGGDFEIQKPADIIIEIDQTGFFDVFIQGHLIAVDEEGGLIKFLLGIIFQGLTFIEARKMVAPKD